MFNFIGNIINSFYNIIGNYAIVLVIIGCFISLLNIYPKIVKIKAYALREKLNPQVEEIKSRNLPKDEEELEIGKLFQSKNYNPILANLPNIILGVVSMIIFIVVLNPFEYMGLSETFSQSFLYYNNIFDKSFDIILPVVLAVAQTAAPLLGQPLKIINKKETVTSLISSLIVYLIFGNVICHLYIIYCLGMTIGNIITNAVLIIPRRKIFNIEHYEAEN